MSELDKQLIAQWDNLIDSERELLTSWGVCPENQDLRS